MTHNNVTGTVKWYNDSKGYGFISCKEIEGDIFVYYSVIEDKGFKTLHEGQLVNLDVLVGPKGPQATRVSK